MRLLLAIAIGCLAAPVAAQIVFSDATAALGLSCVHDDGGETHPSLAGGAVGDFNADGWQDLFVATGGGTPDELYINEGGRRLVNRAAQWGVAVAHRGTGAAVGDYDGDGWLDLFVTSFGANGAVGPGGHRLYRNLGGDGFEEVAAAAGVAQASTTDGDGWGAAWGDYDLDGDLDLAVAGQTSDGNRLFRNDGDGTFTDVTTAAGLNMLALVGGFAPRLVDMDGDRYPELIWIGDAGTSKYLANDGDGSFTDRTASSGTGQDFSEMGFTVADFDADGDLDFYVTTIGTNNLYLQDGVHSYSNQAAAAGVVDTAWGWATAAIDLDHDTRIDLVATSQDAGQFVFENVTASGGSLDFDDVSATSGLVSSISGRGLAAFDVDNDGDRDVALFPYAAAAKLFRNELSSTNHWLRIALDPAGAPSIPPHGVGSTIRVTIGADTLVGRIDGGSNYLSQDEMLAHFGLGDATVVDRVEVSWPDGTTTELLDVAVDRPLTIRATPSGGGSGPGASAALTVGDYDGTLELAYTPACEATTHHVVYGALGDIAELAWSGASCDVGVSGAVAAFDPGPGDAFFIVVGSKGGEDGSYGRRQPIIGAGIERPAFATTPCATVQALDDRCF